MRSQYSILIQWSEPDKTYLVTLPEFGSYSHTHGDTYQEALKNAEEVLELLIEDYEARGKQLPKPLTVKL
ncbi:MAG: hypothetical protein RLZZ338_161 [Cyanobacteriota bacterium]|jgi:predicted RNase H-like HicB family nuclease